MVWLLCTLASREERTACPCILLCIICVGSVASSVYVVRGCDGGPGPSPSAGLWVHVLPACMAVRPILLPASYVKQNYTSFFAGILQAGSATLQAFLLPVYVGVSDATADATARAWRCCQTMLGSPELC
jgi:hypothetical protein